MTDDDLRERLRRADPAVALEPVSPTQVEHLVEEAMSRTPARRWAPAAAAFVLLAGGLTWWSLRPDAEVGVAEPAPTATTTAAAPVPSFQVPSGGQAKCAEPSPEVLAKEAFYAFAGTVTEIDGDQVHLKITHNYRNMGDSVRAATLGQPSGSETLLGSGQFELGKDYLVATTGTGGALICGYSGEADSPGLRELYEAAF